MGWGFNASALFYCHKSKTNIDMETKKRTEKELKQILAGFIGTSTYHLHEIGGLKLRLTDGCDFVRRECNAFWLFDAIVSYQNTREVKQNYYQVWRLKKQKNGTWLLSCEDGHFNVILKQLIEYSDFPLRKFTVWIVNGVAILPGEY